jgi:hypothetical protein
MSLLIVVLVFAALASIGAVIGRHVVKEGTELLSEWTREVLAPRLRPAIQLSIPRLQARIVAAALAAVELTAGGRGALRSPVSILLSPRDLESLEQVHELVIVEIRDELASTARAKKWLVPADLVVDIAADSRVRDGQPQIEMGRLLPASVHTKSRRYVPTALYPLGPRATPARTSARPSADTLRYEDEELISLDGFLAVHLDPEQAVLTLGRAPHCDIVVEHPGVARVHAEIQRRGNTIVLVDLNSPNGTAVNGRPVNEVGLINGDEIQLASKVTNGPRYVFSRLATGEERCDV